MAGIGRDRKEELMSGVGGPLAGVTVLEFASIGPGPYAVMLLADLGAEVVRIDRPDANPEFPERHLLNRGRRSVVLDLKHPDGVAAAVELASHADVVVEGLRPGVMERLGLGPDALLAHNPGLVYGRMTGWGQTGPLARAAGHDLGYIARTGALHASGRVDGPPAFAANLLGDFGGGGMLLAFGICAALLERSTSGKGQVVDAAIVDGVASLMAMPWMLRARGTWQDERGVNELDSGAPYYDVYRTADDKYVSVAPLEPQFYSQLLDGLGLVDAPDRSDPANWPQLRELIAETIASRTRDEWTEAFAGRDACVEPVLSMDEAAQDAHLMARGSYVTAHGHVQPGAVPRFSRTPGSVPPPAVLPGTHTRDVLGEWAPNLDVDALLNSGAATQR